MESFADMKSVDIVVFAIIGSLVLIYVCFLMRRSIAQKRYAVTDWVTASAKMTGGTREVTRRSYKIPGVLYTEYELQYTVNGATYKKWFHLYPGPDLGAVYGAGTEVTIRYSMSNPDIFEVMQVGLLE